MSHFGRFPHYQCEVAVSLSKIKRTDAGFELTILWIQGNCVTNKPDRKWSNTLSLKCAQCVCLLISETSISNFFLLRPKFWRHQHFFRGKIFSSNKVVFGAGALVLWLWEENHLPKVVGSNPDTVYWMDIKNSHIFV